MAKRSTATSKIFVKILWGDAEIGSITRRFTGVRSLTVGKNLMADIRSVVWPLRDDLVILEKDGGRLFLNPDLAWNGLLTCGGEVTILDSRVRGKKNLEIKNGTFATLKVEDITVAIRVGTPLKLTIPKFTKLGSFRSSPLGLIADTPYEQAGLSVGLIAALILTVAFAAGLNRRPVWAPETIADLPDSVRLPFIAPSHFSTAPDVIQDKIDRFHFVESVSKYYHHLATVLTDPTKTTDDSYIFAETRASYKEAAENQSEQLAGLDSNINRLAEDTKKRGDYILSMPVVRGESLDGSLQRILDKISVIQAHAKELSEKRALTGAAFVEDPSYDYGTGAGKSGGDSLADFTKKLGQGFRRTLPDEELQALEAKSLATEAIASQIDLFGKDHLKSGVRDCCEPIVAIKAGSTPVTYTPMPRFTDSDQKLASLKASQWGAPEEKAKTPKIMEPVAGVIDSKALERAIASGRFQLQLCFELALRRNQAAKGSMEWSWKIDSRGVISGISLVRSTLKDEELVQCVRRRIAGWKLPKPKGGSVEIRYPFEFVRDRG